MIWLSPLKLLLFGDPETKIRCKRSTSPMAMAAPLGAEALTPLTRRPRPGHRGATSEACEELGQGTSYLAAPVPRPNPWS